MNSAPDKTKWLTLREAAQQYGYSNYLSVRRRLRQLRERGLVIDLGNPPQGYQVGERDEENKVVLLWPHPQTALIRSDAPRELFNPQRGRRAAYGRKGR